MEFADNCINVNYSRSEEIIQAYINVIFFLKIILVLLKLTPDTELRLNSISRYNQLYKAVDSFDVWDETNQIDFLTQFFPLSDLLDQSCTEIVSQFCVSFFFII